LGKGSIGKGKEGRGIQRKLRSARTIGIKIRRGLNTSRTTNPGGDRKKSEEHEGERVSQPVPAKDAHGTALHLIDPASLYLHMFFGSLAFPLSPPG
jgi:hypothetical protein